MSDVQSLVDKIHQDGQRLIMQAVSLGRAAKEWPDLFKGRSEKAKQMFIDGWSMRRFHPSIGSRLNGSPMNVRLTRREVIRALEAFDQVVHDPNAWRRLGPRQERGALGGEEVNAERSIFRGLDPDASCAEKSAALFVWEGDNFRPIEGSEFGRMLERFGGARIEPLKGAESE